MCRSTRVLRDMVRNAAIDYWIGLNAHAVCYLLKGGNLFNIVLVCSDNLPELVDTQQADAQETGDFFEK